MRVKKYDSFISFQKLKNQTEFFFQEMAHLREGRSLRHPQLTNHPRLAFYIN